MRLILCNRLGRKTICILVNSFAALLLMGSTEASNDALATNLRHWNTDFSPERMETLASGDASPQEHDSGKLQALLCETRSPDPGVMTLAIRNKLSKVGGWFSVRRTRELLDEDAIFERGLKKNKRDSDMYFDRPSDLALQLLPKLLPQAGLPKADRQGHNKGQLIKSWKQWISDHQAELQEMKPTGGGVDFSPGGCRNGKPFGGHR
jgi:hypothetical protein